MKLTRIAVTAAMMLTMSAAAVVAQTATTPVTTPERPAVTGKSIQQRKVNQQDRIAQGVKSGRLNAGETARLERQESGINKEERGMRAQDNGKLTRQDKSTINHQQNVESRRIHRDKNSIAAK